MPKPDHSEHPVDPRWRGTSRLGADSPEYPYVHLEALHSERLSIDVDDLLEFLEHYRDEGPDIVSDVQPP